MYHKIMSQTDFNIVTLSEAKAQLRLTDSFTMDDTRIEGLISVACELAQTYTNRMLSVGEVAMGSYEYKSQVQLWGEEVDSITSVVAQYGGEEVLLTDCTFDVFSQTVRIPQQYRAHTDFVITYSAGYSTAPHKVKQGVLLLIATMYNNTEDFLVGQTHEQLPLSSLRILDSVKVYYGAA